MYRYNLCFLSRNPVFCRRSPTNEHFSRRRRLCHLPASDYALLFLQRVYTANLPRRNGLAYKVPFKGLQSIFSPNDANENLIANFIDNGSATRRKVGERSRGKVEEST